MTLHRNHPISHATAILPYGVRSRRRRWSASLLTFIAVATLAAIHAEAQSKVPHVQSVSFANRPARGDTYELGEKIEVMVGFNRSVELVETTLKVALTVGDRTRHAEFYAIRVERGVERDLYFYYTVRADDLDADGIGVPAGALSLERGTVKALANRNVDAALTHGAVAADARRKVDGSRVTAPRVSHIHVLADHHEVGGGTTRRDQHVYVRVEFDRAVRVTGVPRVALTIGTETRWASFYPIDSWTDLDPESTFYFCYAVQREDRDLDGISIPANALSLNGGARITLAGDAETDAVLSHGASDHSYWRVRVDGGSAADGDRSQGDNGASETSTGIC